MSSHVSAFAQTCVQPPSGIIAWWPFDETSGTTAQDVVGSNPGAYVDGPTPASGKVGSALQFGGPNDFAGSYVGVGDSDLWAFGSNDFTIELWANFDMPVGGSIGHPGDIFIGNDAGSGTQNKWFFALGGGVLHFHINGPSTGSYFLVQAPFSPIVGQWYQLAVTRNGSTYTIFVDGTPIGSETNTVAIPNANAPLTIGQAESIGFMNGLLDEMTIYNRALPQAELQAIVNASSAGKCKALAIATRAVPAVKLGDASSFQFKSQFGVPPFSWTIAGGTLPSGMDLSSDGILSGAPTQPGSFSFTVKVTDSNNDTAEKSFTQDVVLILPPPNIRIHKTGTAAVPGRSVDYFIVVENAGQTAATDLVVSELVDPWFTFLGGTPGPSKIERILDYFPEPEPTSEYDALITWNLPQLQPGEMAIISYQVGLDPQFPIGGTVHGTECLLDQASDAAAKCLINMRECLAKAAGACRLSGVVFAPCMEAGFTGCVGAWLGCTVGNIIPLPSNSQGLAAAAATTAANTGGGICEANPRPAQGAIDPNEKLVVAKRFVRPEQMLAYPIHFENVGTIEARDVFVTDVLDSNLDTSTLQILTPDGSFDAATRTVKWSLLNIDLQPQATGNVLLSIKPKPNLPSGTEIRNKATIQFEVFTPMDTNEVVNIIDSTRPTCTLNPLLATTSTLSFPISWSGTDAIGEIESYSVLVSVDGGSFTTFLDKTTDTSATFTGELGKTYGFLCIATDTAGNIEVQDAAAETTTTITTTDLCPNDPNKTAPGVCGCGVADTDSDNDGAPNCNDQCPSDPNQTTPDVEICNGLDDNCNGTVDDGFNVGGSCTVGVGACQRTGIFVCSANGQSTQCNATAGSPSVEVCNNSDDDCDGSVDEGVCASACAANVSAQVNVTRGGYRRNSATGRYVQQVTLKNTGSMAIPGPVSLVLDTLSSNAALFSPTGNTSCATPVSPYKNVSVGADNVLSVGETTTIVLEFTNPTNASITYSTRVLGGSATR